jgi:hypothetical protein
MERKIKIKVEMIPTAIRQIKNIIKEKVIIIISIHEVVQNQMKMRYLNK